MAYAADARIGRLRQELHLHPNFEFHFNKCNRKIRIYFLESVAPYGFFYCATVINKDPEMLSRYGINHQDIFNDYTGGRVFQDAKEFLNNALVVMDGEAGNSHFGTSLVRLLKKQVNAPGRRCIRKVKLQESSRNNLIQMADMVVGAVNRSFGSKDDAHLYRGIVSARERQVEVWPK